jgi:hypothetical protein
MANKRYSPRRDFGRSYRKIPAQDALSAHGEALALYCDCRLRQPHRRKMLFESSAKRVRIRVGDVHDSCSQIVACNLPNLDDAGEPHVLGDVNETFIRSPTFKGAAALSVVTTTIEGE